MKIKTLAIFLTAVIFVFYSCGKKSGQETTKTEDKKEQTTTQTEQKPNKEDSIKQVQKDQADKEQKIKEALADEKILNDTLGQWAIDAEVSSTYGDENGTDKTHPYTKYQLTGKPDVENYQDDGRALVSKEADKRIE